MLQKFAELSQISNSRHEADVTALASLNILQLFIEYAPAAIAMFDRDMKYLFVSKRFISDYRLNQMDVKGKSHYEVFPEIPEHWKEVHRRCLKGENIECDEDSFLRQNGEIEYIRWEIRPWFEAPGTIGGIVLFSEVITERKKTEMELYRLKADLERQIENKTRELKTKVDELERFQEATIEREFRMKDLRDEIENLKKQFRLSGEKTTNRI